MCIITAWQHISPGEIVKSFTKCCISSAMDGAEVDKLWNGSEEGGNVRSEREEDEDTVLMETVTLIGKGRQNVTCCMY
jgi:hypothetical protein